MKEIINDKKVVILGAGPSGLVAAKYAKEYGLEPIILEKNSELGGLWNSNTGLVWNTMKTNLSKYSCSFSDFSWKKEAPVFPSSSEMFDYLQKYTDTFGIIPHIKFNSKVTSVKRNKTDTAWEVNWEEEGQKKEMEVPYVIVATGIFSEPHFPEIPGLKDFQGVLVHSKDYKDGNKFKDQKVLVVGGSLTAVEIASDVSNYATVTHSFKEPFWVLERYIPTLPSQKVPMDLAFYKRGFYETDLPPVQERYEGKNKYMEKLCHKQQEIKDLKVEGNFKLPIKITISDNYISQVNLKKIDPKKSNIVKFDENKAIFSDISEEKFDSIILSTGYRANLTYLDKAILEKLSYDEKNQIQPILLYQETLHPEIPNMFFVGMYKGPYFAVMEYQAKWACKVFSKMLQLPSKEEMYNGIKGEQEIRDMNPKMQFPHPDYVKFADDIARLAGENLDLVKLKLQNELVYKDFLSMSVFPGHFTIDNAEGQIEEVKNILGECTIFSDIIN